ncbi:MAG: DnaB-like helicase C-terminal domain-containing protein [Bacillota bacterium]
MPEQANYRTADDVFGFWRDDVLSGKPQALYPIGTGELARIEVGPNLVTLIGGAPGAGKTALIMQAVTDALRLTPALKAVVCNVEMPPEVLLDRQLARLSGIALSNIRHRQLGARHADRIDVAMKTLESLVERLCFVRPPFNLANVAATADAFDAGLIVLDYIQRIHPPSNHDDHRGAVNETMGYLRQFADTGVAVVVISAVGRTKDSKGRSSYSGDGLTLASFRESSELEFGADDAFILCPEEGEGGTLKLKHVKSRHGEARDIVLAFDRRHQQFTATASDKVRDLATPEPTSVRVVEQDGASGPRRRRR